MNGVMEKLDADAVVLTAGAASAVIKRHSKTVSQHKKYLIKSKVIPNFSVLPHLRLMPLNFPLRLQVTN